MQIIRGKQKTALKVVVYGPEGIGKSTFAAQFPNPLFIDTEGGTKHMDVARTPKPTSWVMLLGLVKECIADPSLCGTLIIDTMDWAELLCSRYVCDKAQKKSIEEFGYGKRAVGTGILGDEIDLNDIDTSGMYRVQKPKNGPYDYGQLLVIHGYGDTIAQVCFDYAANRCAVRCARGLYGASPKWEDWTAIALCAAPEVHELPLVDNITSNNIVYYKSQEGIVTIVGSVAGDFPASQSTVIGNVPEGFRPAYMIEVPAAFTMGATGNASVDASGHVSVAPYLGGLRYAYVAFSYPTG